MLSWGLKKAMNKDFILIVVYVFWFISSLLFTERLGEMLTAADFGPSENILGSALWVAAVAPYVLLTTKIFQVSIRVEHGTSGIQRAFIALCFMVFCCALIVFIWTAKTENYTVHLSKWINEPSFYDLAGVAIISFWVHQVFYNGVKAYEFSLSSIGMGLAVACHLVFFYLFFNESELCDGGVCGGIHVGAKLTVFSIVGVFVILVTYMTRDWLRSRAGDFHHVEANKIIQAYGQHMIDNPISTEILDEKILPHPKEKILKAICWSISLSDEKMHNQLNTGALFLANYQKGVGSKPIGSFGRSGDAVVDFNSEMDAFVQPDGTIDPAFGVDQVECLMVNREEHDLWLKLQSLVEKDTQRILKKLDDAKRTGSRDKFKPLGK